GRRHVLLHEAANEPVVASTAANGAEADGATILVLHFECEIGFKNYPGIVFKATNDRWINSNHFVVRRPGDEPLERAKIFNPISETGDRPVFFGILEGGK